MDEEELPSESTSRPRFRRNNPKKLMSVNANNSSSTAQTEKDQRTTTRTMITKRIVKPTKRSNTKKKSQVFVQRPN